MPSRPREADFVVVWSGGGSTDALVSDEDVVRYRAGQGTGTKSEADSVLTRKPSWRTEAKPLAGDRNADEGTR